MWSNQPISFKQNIFGPQVVPFHSDVDHPTVFWIMNAYNDFEYNMAVGAETCGACYWLVPGSISGMSRMQTWEGYAYRLPPNVKLIPLSRDQKKWLSTFDSGMLVMPAGGPQVIQLILNGRITSTDWSNGYFTSQPLREVLERHKELYLGQFV